MVEHLFEAQGVGGSIPSLGTKFAPLVKWMITLCYERRGGGSIPSWGTKYLMLCRLRRSSPIPRITYPRRYDR